MNRFFVGLLLISMIFSTSVSAKDKDWTLERIGVAFNTAGLNDMAFNRPVHEGILQAAMKSNLKVTTKVADFDGDEEKVLRDLIDQNCDLIVGVGFPMIEPLRAVATDHKDRKFLLIDAELNLPNVISVIFREQEGSFLSGVLASKLSRTGIVGFVGGADVEVINRFRDGYVKGAKHENPKIRVTAEYVGEGVPAFTSPAKASAISKRMIDGGADVLFHAAGYSGLGVIRAAQEAGVLVIGVDYDQSFLAPGTVAGSLVKRIRPASADIIRRLARGLPVPNTLSLGLAERSLEITGLEKSNAIKPGIRARLLLLERNIADGTLKID